MMLSPIQEEIVELEGNLIVRASAGTGKTHTMVSKIVKEISDNKTHKVIAAITFTIKAAQEIRDRLTIDSSRHFIGTNNSFAIEEIIKPFMKDVYGLEFDLDFSTDYSQKIETFEEGINRIKEERVICTYRNNKKNFVFELARNIVENSLACRLFLKAKYFKVYIDEYQDCDQDMHMFFMYLCDTLNIKTFIVGDEKQSIYIWRGAYPEAFKSIWYKQNFKKKFMADNFRSCQQIQNYSNLLFEETRNYYKPISNLENIIILDTTSFDWAHNVLKLLNTGKRTALLRYSNDNAKLGADELSERGSNFIYIPQTPIADITTESAWLYNAVAKSFILDKYSVYDFISEIPSEGTESRAAVSQVKRLLKVIKDNIEDEGKFREAIELLADYLGNDTSDEHIDKLYETITESKYHAAFNAERYQNISITLHSSKGLEFDQVILFAEDFRLNDDSNIYTHYVASTRAKEKLIIVKFSNYGSNCFISKLSSLFSINHLKLEDVVSVE